MLCSKLKNFDCTKCPNTKSLQAFSVRLVYRSFWGFFLVGGALVSCLFWLFVVSLTSSELWTDLFIQATKSSVFILLNWYDLSTLIPLSLFIFEVCFNQCLYHMDWITGFFGGGFKCYWIWWTTEEGWNIQV